MAITFLIRCNWIVVARLSQNALCQSLNAGATTPIAAPAMTNWLRLLHARVNADENHRLVIAFGREHELLREGEGGAADCQGADEVPTVESPKSAAART